MTNNEIWSVIVTTISTFSIIINLVHLWYKYPKIKNVLFRVFVYHKKEKNENKTLYLTEAKKSYLMSGGEKQRKETLKKSLQITKEKLKNPNLSKDERKNYIWDKKMFQWLIKSKTTIRCNINDITILEQTQDLKMWICIKDNIGYHLCLVKNLWNIPIRAHKETENWMTKLNMWRYYKSIKKRRI